MQYIYSAAYFLIILLIFFIYMIMSNVEFIYILHCAKPYKTAVAFVFNWVNESIFTLFTYSGIFFLLCCRAIHVA